MHLNMSITSDFTATVGGVVHCMYMCVCVCVCMCVCVYACMHLVLLTQLSQQYLAI